MLYSAAKPNKVAVLFTLVVTIVSNGKVLTGNGCGRLGFLFQGI